MKRKTIKKLGIIILSSMIVASPVVTPFTTMTVYAATISSGEQVDENTQGIESNFGTITTNEDTVESNYGTITTNEDTVESNYGTITTNNGTVVYNANAGVIDNNKNKVDSNYGTVGTNEGTVESNYDGGTIETNNGSVSGYNYGTIKTNKGSVNTNSISATIENNYGSIGWNYGTVENNYTTLDGKGTVAGGTVTNQWYEVKLGNNEAEVKIKGNSIQDNNGSGYIDVFAKEASAITIYSTNPRKIIDAIEGDISYVKNADGSITISGITSVYSLLTTLGDKIFEPASSESKKNNNDNKKKDEVVIEVSFAEPVFAAPVVQALTQPQIVVPAGAVNAVTVVAENPAAATQAAKTLQNDPVVVAQAQELTVYMEAVTAAYKEVAVKELAAVPNQAVVGSAEYEVKQAVIVADLTNQVASLSNLTVQSLAVVQKIGVSVVAGGCTKLDAANVSLLNEILAKGIPVTITYAIDGAPVTIKIPAGVNLTRFIGADGRLDLTKLRAYIVR